MAEVTGLTAERMLEIEANCIVRGAIVLDRLKLYTQGGAEIDGGSLTTGTAPVGSITMFAGPNAPAGWLLCDGMLYSSTDARYRPLWDVIGYRYGQSGTSFRVPNFQDRFPLGQGLNGIALAAALGDQKIRIANLPNHRHNITRHIHRMAQYQTNSGGSHTHGIGGTASNTSTSGGGSRRTTSGTSNTASGGGHRHTIPAKDTNQSDNIWTNQTENAIQQDYRPRYLGVNFIIKT